MTIALAKSAPRTSTAQVFYVDQDVALGCDDDVFIVLWHDRTTVQGVETLIHTFDLYAEARNQRDVALMTIIESRAKMPSPGSRELLAQFLNRAGSTLVVSAVAFEGDGFMAASIRSVIVGLTMLARQSFPHRVFKDVAEASAWIESQYSVVGKRFAAQAIEEAATSFRHKVGQRWTQRSGVHTI